MTRWCAARRGRHLRGPCESFVCPRRHQVKPSDIFFSHSKIRPVFTGNGKTLEQTYEELRDGRTTLNDMPILRVWYDG